MSVCTFTLVQFRYSLWNRVLGNWIQTAIMNDLGQTQTIVLNTVESMLCVTWKIKKICINKIKIRRHLINISHSNLDSIKWTRTWHHCGSGLSAKWDFVWLIYIYDWQVNVESECTLCVCRWSVSWVKCLLERISRPSHACWPTWVSRTNTLTF